MRLSPKSLALACGLLWGCGVLTVGLINLAVPGYGVEFLKSISSVYYGFRASGGFVNALVGGVYGFVDGAIAGLLVAWLYNLSAAPAGSK
jgi:hypothetical protein